MPPRLDTTEQLIVRTHRVPLSVGRAGPGGAYTRQLDSTCLKGGFKLSGPLFQHLAQLHPGEVEVIGAQIIRAIRAIVGDHVEHNVYFIDFPAHVPDTEEFWWSCIRDALNNPESAAKIKAQVAAGRVNLLDLPRYGTYLHSFTQMLEAHEAFIPCLSNAITILELGGTFPEELIRLYHQLAGSAVPLNEDDLVLLKELATTCLDAPQPERIPVRENKAVINAVRVRNNQPIDIDTVTDVLRIACVLSGGDVTLQTPTRFRSFSRAIRGNLLSALNTLISTHPGRSSGALPQTGAPKASPKLEDVLLYQEEWKRLGERLHPHEHTKVPRAQDIFTVARGEVQLQTLASKVENAFLNQTPNVAAEYLRLTPGKLYRQVDRLLRAGVSIEYMGEAILQTLTKVSSRVLLSVREHLQNRGVPEEKRLFINRTGKAWVTDDTRAPLAASAVKLLLDLFDRELASRLPHISAILLDPLVRQVAIPLSQKTQSSGFGILPRGAMMPVSPGLLRFFCYWKEAERRTDYDLSALFLNEAFEYVGQTSWTNLRAGRGMIVHSGDITHAEKGASEFIDIKLEEIEATRIVPQLNIYAGESFDEIAECFVGYMSRTAEQKGLPFEPRAVRAKSDLRGAGKVALPLAFCRREDGVWYAKWMHLLLKGSPSMNRVETNRLSTGLLAKAVLRRRYLTLEYVCHLAASRGAEILELGTDKQVVIPSTDVVFLGMTAPRDRQEGMRVYTPVNFGSLVGDLLSVTE